MALVPLVLVVMNVVYAVGAYPFGKLSDRMSHTKLLAWGLVVLIAADVVLAYGNHGLVWVGVALWGLHMGMTQGLLAAMVADTAPADLRGTAYGFFNLVSGIGDAAGKRACRAAVGSAWSIVHICRRRHLQCLGPGHDHPEKARARVRPGRGRSRSSAVIAS